MSNRKKSSLGRSIKNNIKAWALLAPSLIFMLGFTVYPIFKTFYLSLTKYKMGMKAPEFTGFDNFIKLAQTPLFWKVIGNTAFWALLTAIPSMIVGLGLAILINRKTKLLSFLRVSYFYPVVLPMIAVASIWSFIYMANNGLVDQTLIKLGLEPLLALSKKDTVLPALAGMYVWKEAGYLMVFFLSGLQAISPEVMEAAKIDGSRGLHLFRHITFPLLGPTFLFVSSVEFTNCFKLVDHVMIMTEGAPNNASTLLLYYIYQQGFTNFNYGTSSALSVIMLVTLLIVSIPRFFRQDKKVHYN
ncbi:MAG TPA: sugar ABC transporter permease [Clostridiaceae bacterium]|nr:sugar ABC transporter permease [Clostridiaceae bacterium]